MYVIRWIRPLGLHWNIYWLAINALTPNNQCFNVPRFGVAGGVWFEVASGRKLWFLRVFFVKTWVMESISAVPLHINSISSYVPKTWWVHWRWVACKINYWHCPLRNPILRVCSLFHFLKMSSYIKKYVSCVTLESSFTSCQHVGTLWLGCMWCGLGIETTESYRWKSSSLRFT